MSSPILIVLSAPELYVFMAGQVGRLRGMGYRPVMVSARSQSIESAAKADGFDFVSVDIRREISPLADFRAFFSLAIFMVRRRPSSVLLSGPKAIFLAGMAAWLVGVPVRISVYHGMRQERMRGPRRMLLDVCDQVSFATATRVLVVSPSLLAEIRRRGLDHFQHACATLPGTANGVDFARLGGKDEWPALRTAARRQLNIATDARVAIFLGRVTEDKGLLDIEHAFLVAKARCPSLILLVVGPDEVHTPSGRACLARLSGHADVRIVGGVTQIVNYLAAADVLLFPSHREGFGMVVLEAGHMGLPAVAYDVTGVRDAVVDGHTGILVPLGRQDLLAEALTEYLCDVGLCHAHGAHAQRHASRYQADAVWQSYSEALECE